MFKKPYKSKPHSDKKPFDNSMHTATCSGCGKECQVPFKPNGKKPVFCSACYVREDKAPGGFEPRKDRSDFYEKKSSYQGRSHERTDSRATSGGMTSDQYKQLNAKLDLILKLVQGDE